MKYPLHALFGLLTVGACFADVTYVDCTASNTVSYAGGTWSTTANSGTDNLWRLRTEAGIGNGPTAADSGHTVYEANQGSAPGEDAPGLTTTITGLTPNTDYKVFAYFWSPYDSNWHLRASVNSLPPLADDSSVQFSRTGTSASTNAPALAAGVEQGNMGVAYTESGGLFGASTYRLISTSYFTNPVLLCAANRYLYQAALGTKTSNASGEIKVYIDDKNNTGNANRSWIDGVGYRLAGPDADSDGIEDAFETNTDIYTSPTATGTDPNDPDSDNDGLSDGAEVITHFTNPNYDDTDGDGLLDGYEINTSLTNPLVYDTDGDTLGDGDEVNSYLSDPLSVDGDADGYRDNWEVNHSTDPMDAESPAVGSQRNSIGIKFSGNAGSKPNYNLEPLMYAGAPNYVQKNWNRATAQNVGATANIATPSAGVLVDGGGIATTALVSWSSPNTWSAANETLTPYGRLHGGYLDSNSTTNASVTIDQIPYSRYDVVVYMGSAINSPLANKVTLNGVDYRYGLGAIFTDGNDPVYVRSNDSSANFATAFNPSSNYIIFRGVTGSSATITHTRLSSNAGIYGVQIVEDLDSDSDGMGDKFEESNGLNKLVNDAASNLDTDGLTNLQEHDLGTDPNDFDTDDDGLSDGAERNMHLSNPFIADTDGDTLTDGAEINTHGSSPLLIDTDADGYRDPYEVDNSTQPANAESPGGPNPLAVGIAFDNASGEQTNYPFAATTYAGVAAVRQKNWNRTSKLASSVLTAGTAQIAQPSAGLLVDSAGAATGMTFSLSSAGVWSDLNEQNTPYGHLYNAFAYNSSAVPNVNVSLANIPYPNYDVYVYVGADFNGRTGVVTSGTTSYSFTSGSNATSVGGLSDYVETTAATGNPVANYCVFRNQTASSFVFNVTRGSNNVGTFGIQVVKTTGSAYGAWAISKGLDPLTDGAPGFDKDNDGADNLSEYAFFTNPNSGSSTPAQVIGAGGLNLTLTYLRAKAATDVTFIAEASTNLADWTTVGVTDAATGNENADTVEYSASVAKASDTAKFLRIRVVLSTTP